MFFVQIATRIFGKFTHNAEFSLCVQSLPFIWYFSVLKCILLVSEVIPPASMTWDYTTSSADDQPGNQGPHGLLCWETAWESGTTALLCDPPTEEWRSYSGRNWLIRQGIQCRLQSLCAKPSLYLILLCVLKCILLVSEVSPPAWVTWDYTASSTDYQPRSQGPHNQLSW